MLHQMHVILDCLQHVTLLHHSVFCDSDASRELPPTNETQTLGQQQTLLHGSNLRLERSQHLSVPANVWPRDKPGVPES